MIQPLSTLKRTFIASKNLLTWSHEGITAINPACFGVINKGQGNCLVVGEGTRIKQTKFQFYGSNNLVVLGANSNINKLDARIWGSNSAIFIGSFTYVGSLSCHIKSDSGSIEIGDGCLVANNVSIHTSDHHPIYELSTGSRVNPDKNVRIMRHVWIGGNVSIQKGVTISQDSVIGRGAIVTRDVDSNCVYAGVPARKVKSGITWDNFMNSSYEQARKNPKLLSRNAQIEEFCLKHSIDSDLFFYPEIKSGLLKKKTAACSSAAKDQGGQAARKLGHAVTGDLTVSSRQMFLRTTQVEPGHCQE